jgi:integrase
MANKAGQFGPNIEKIGNRFFAVLKVPQDVRGDLGRTTFRKTLGTDSQQEARRRAPLIVAAWQSQIAVARNGGDDPWAADAAWFRNALATSASPDKQEKLLEKIGDYASEIAQAGGSIEDTGEFAEPDPSGEAEAQKFYDIATGTNAPTGEFIDEWLTTKAVGNTPKTIEQKRKELSRFTARFPTLSQVSRKDVQKLCEDLVLTDGLGTGTASRALSTWRGYWKYLRQHQHVPDDIMPLNEVEVPKQTQKNAKILPYEPSDVARLVRAAEGRKKPKWDEVADLIRIAAYTGVRREEVCSLKVRDVDLSNRCFSVTDAKTKAGVRTVPIHSAAMQVFRQLCTDNDGYVFAHLLTDKWGNRGDAIGKRFGRLKKELGFSKQHDFHSLRHTVTTMLANAEVEPDVISDIVGHEKTNFSLKKYTPGFSLEIKANAIAKLKYPVKL